MFKAAILLIFMTLFLEATSGLAASRLCLQTFKDSRTARIQKVLVFDGHLLRAHLAPMKELFSFNLKHEFSLSDFPSDQKLVADLKSLMFSKSISESQAENILQFLEKNHIQNKQIIKESKFFSLDSVQTTALRLVRVLDRDIELLPAVARPTPVIFQQAKERILMLAGFSHSQIEYLKDNRLLNDDVLSATRYSFETEPTQVTREAIWASNQNLIEQSYKLTENTKSNSGRIRKISFEMAEKLNDDVAFHPVLEFDSRHKYDPDESTGFCFGRACAVHGEAIPRGIDKRSIRKVFLYGPMQGNVGNTWIFHVATAIESDRGGFWVIDPNFDNPMKVEQWLEIYQKNSQDGRLRLFFTPADRFGADGFHPYQNNESGLKNPFYRNYFVDWFQDFKARLKLKKQTNP